MIQKVLASATFIAKPKVLIMDEPMTGLDPEAQYAFKRRVKKLVDSGATAVISSHLLDLVERFCTKIGIIHKGKPVIEGTIDEVKKKALKGRCDFGRQ